MKSKNLDIQLFKFLYACVIVIYHLAGSTAIACPGGYYAVDYFLLTAGLFLFLTFEKNDGTDRQITPGAYLAKRFCRLLPWSITGFIAAVIVNRLFVERVTSVSYWINKFPSDFWEIVMAKGTGINAGALLINGPAWTISSMLIVGFLFWILLFYYKKTFLNVVLPISLIIGWGIWANLPSANTEGWIGFTTFGTFRTWIVFGVSYYCMVLGKKLSTINFTKYGEIALTMVELLLHGIAFYFIFEHAQRPTQWLLIVAFMLAISIAVSGHSYIARLLSKLRIINFLGEVSISIYLVHSPVMIVFRNVYNVKEWGWVQLLPLFGTVFVAAVIHYFGTNWLVRGFGYVKTKMARVLID